MLENLIEVYDIMYWDKVGKGMTVRDLLYQSGIPRESDKVGATVELALYVDNVRYNSSMGREEIIDALEADELSNRIVKQCEFRSAKFQVRI